MEPKQIHQCSHHRRLEMVDWVFNNCPRASENIYVDGVKILKYRIKETDDSDAKNKLIDTLMMVYDQRIKYFPLHYKTKKPQEGAILGRKGVSLYKFRPQEYKQVNEILRRAIDLDKENSSGQPMFTISEH